MITQHPNDDDYDRGFDDGFFAAFRLLTDELPEHLDRFRREVIEELTEFRSRDSGG